MSGIFVLGNNVVGSSYIMPGVQVLAEKEVEPEGFAFRKLSYDKKLLVTILGADGRRDHIPLHCFSKHPPEEEIRKRNNLRGII